MKKNKFLKELRLHLNLLPDDEIDEIILEYKGYIDSKISSGLTEEEAVATFGIVSELAQDILLPYRRKIKQENDPIGDFAQKMFHVFEKVFNDLMHKSPKDIIRFIIEILILLLIIALFHVPVSLLVSIGKVIFDILTTPLNRFFFVIWKFVLEFSYIIISINVFTKVFCYRYLKGNDTYNYKKTKKIITKEKSNILKYSKILLKIVIGILKFLVVLFLFFITIYLIGMAFVLGICGYLLLQGVTYIGIYIIMFILFVLGILFFQLLFKFVIDEENKKSYLWQFILCFFILGLGCAITTFEIAHTEFINRPPADIAMEKLTEELIMKKDTVFIGNISNYEIDNTLDTIKVVYEYYPLGNKMSTDIEKNNSFVYLNWNLETFQVDTKFLRHIINDLKEKKIYNYYLEPIITIVANEEQVNLIKKNRQNYYQSESDYQSCQFTRTYTVEMLKENATEEVYSVVLSQYLVDELATVQLPSKMAKSMKVGASYEFTFKTYQAYIDTDIQDIFEENEVIAIKLTDKKGIEQIQDHTCTLFY